MIIDLQSSDMQTSFYAKLFIFIKFDYIPTDELYETIFSDIINEPYSEMAENLGYESRYIVQNSGSIFIYIIFVGAL